MSEAELSTLSIIMSVWAIIIIGFNIFIIYWLNKMNVCKCSANFSERKYLYEWYIFMIIWLIIYFIIIISYNGILPTPIYIINSIIGFINLVMIVRLFIYLRKLRETNCNCGTLRELTIIYYYLIFLFSLFAFIILLGIFAGLFAGVAVAKLNKSLK